MSEHWTDKLNWDGLLQSGDGLRAMTEHAEEMRRRQFEKYMDALTPYGPYLPVPWWKRFRNRVSSEVIQARWWLADRLRALADWVDA